MRLEDGAETERKVVKLVCGDLCWRLNKLFPLMPINLLMRDANGEDEIRNRK